MSDDYKKRPSNSSAGPSANSYDRGSRKPSFSNDKPFSGKPTGDKVRGDKFGGGKPGGGKFGGGKGPGGGKGRGDDRRGYTKRRDDAPSRPDGHRPPTEGAFYSDDQQGDTKEAMAQLEQRMAGLSARRAALDILRPLDAEMDLEHALNKTRTFQVLEGSDRAFARNLVSTTLRHRGTLDGVIGHFMDRPLPEKSAEAMDILRIAATQILFLETPPHAAVATAVELAALKRELAGYKGMINAICRKIVTKGPALLAKQPARANTPGWLYRSWERAFGAGKTRAIVAAHARESGIDLILKPETNADELATKIEIEIAETKTTMSRPLPNIIRLRGSVNVPRLPGYAEGDWWVQDLAASLPVRMLGDVAGKTVLDLCAAPGGKTMQLAAAGALVTAVDKAPFRLSRLKENLERTNLEARVRKTDVLTMTMDDPVDAILLDAPCSATGTIRKNPDVVWRKTEEEVTQLAILQGQFIDRALDLLKVGGTLVYCTCSLQRAEGEDQVKAALARHGDTLALSPITSEDVGGLKQAVTSQGTLRTFPSMMSDEGGMDGFFAARFIKKA